MIIFFLILGMLLISFGAIIMLTAVPFTSWDASWPEIKNAFHMMASKPRFQAGTACFVIGLLLLLLFFMLMIP